MTGLSFQFGTVGAPISTPKSPGGSVGAIVRLSELGLDAFEMGWVRSVRVGEKTCKSINLTALESNVTVSVHAPYYINMNARPDEWQKARKRLMDAAHFGNLAGAKNAIFHPGTCFGEHLSTVLPRIRERLVGCIKELRVADNQIVLRPETMGKIGLIGSVEDTLKICEGIEGAEPCLDFAHIHAREGDGGMNSFAEWCEMLDQYESRLEEGSLQRLTCHLSGIAYNQNGETHHLSMKESDFGLHALFAALLEKGCRGRILNESPAMEDDALDFKQTWIEISGETDDE